MNLYVLTVHPNWNYCGGGAAIIAESVDAAEKMLRDEEDDEDTRIISKEVMCADNTYHWVIAGVFPVAETKARVVMCSYNYA